jgi:hypothetical protein
MPVPCELRSTAPQTAKRTSEQRRWRRPTPYRRGSPDTLSPRGLTSPDRDPCANPHPRSSAACWRPPGSSSHRRQTVAPNQTGRDARLDTPLECAAKTVSLTEALSHPRCRACRTIDRQGSAALRGRSTTPNGSQRHIPRRASGSSVPDRSTDDPWTNNEVQVRREATTDQQNLVLS